MARDPVCGMSVEPAKAAASAQYGGVPVYFCSAACQKKYNQSHTPD